MIILEYLILVLAIAAAYYHWDTREKMKQLVQEHLQFRQIVATKLEGLVDGRELKSQLSIIEGMFSTLQSVIVNKHNLYIDRMDDLQRSTISRQELDKFMTELTEKERIIKEAQIKLKQDSMKKMKIAFGGKEEE